MGTDIHNSSAISFGTSVIGLGSLLGAISLCLRSSLGIVPLFVAANYTFVFVTCFAGAVLVLGIGYLLSSTVKTFINRFRAVANLSTVVAISCSLLAAISTFLVLTQPLLAAILFGIFFGIGFACSLEVWLTRFSAFSWGEIILGIALSLLVASIIWMLSSVMVSPLTQCIFCAIIMLFSSAFLLIKPTTFEQQNPSEDTLPISGSVSAATVTSTDVDAAHFDRTPNSTPTGMGKLLKQSWGAFVLLVFNLFTLGLTFLPVSAGVEHSGVSQSGVSQKILAYLIIVAIVWLVMRRITRYPSETQRILGMLYHLSLPVAAAIMLVTPFLDNLMLSTPGGLLGILSYLGIAWGNMLGLAVFAFLIKYQRTRAPKLCGLLLVGCALGFCAGTTIFAALGTGGQVVSLCVLAVYLTALVISELFANASWNKQPFPTDFASADNTDNPRVAVREVSGMAATLATNTTATGGNNDNNEGSGNVSAADSTAQAESSTAAQAAIADITDAIAKRYALSSREAEVLHYLARGRSAKYIAEQLYISPETVRTHSKRIYTKTGVHTREELLSLIEHFE